MSTFGLRLFSRVAAVILGVLPAGVAVLAQPAAYYASTTVDSSKGYWKVQTDYNTRNTVIRFYDEQDRVIYQETLKGRYVKLTKRNIRLFDSTLQRLMGQGLLSEKLKSHELVAGGEGIPYGTFMKPKPVAYEPDLPVATPEANGMRVHPSVSPVGKLRMIFDNPAQEKVLISLVDSYGAYIYKELYQQQAYRRLMDITKLASGRYTFRIESGRKGYYYRLTIGQEPGDYELKPVKSKR